MEYNVKLEYRLEPTEANGSTLVDAFTGFSPAAGPTDTGKLDVWITIQAKDARQAIDVGLALGAKATDAELTAFEVLTTEDFDRRNGLTPVPELIGADEAAEILGISRQAVSKKFGHGDLPGHRVGERVLVFARNDIEAIAQKRAELPGYLVAAAADGEVYGWFNTEAEAEQYRAGSDRLYVRKPHRGDEWPATPLSAQYAELA
jgi:hypothetical protein